MKIFDLTRGKYPQMYDGGMKYEENVDNTVEKMVQHCWKFQYLFQVDNKDSKSLLNDVQIFLVDSTMAREYVPVPECQCAILVPEDSYTSPCDDEEFDIDEWVNSKEGESKDYPRERRSLGIAIYDLLGAYIFNPTYKLMSRRIFVWMDKIKDYAQKNTKVDVYKTSNALALFDLVLFHEIGHALVDVGLYGILPAPNFSYAGDYVYRFIEEAYANAIALDAIYEDLQKPQKDFIRTFVDGQKHGYSYGWDLMLEHVNNVDQWISIKVLFNYETALLIRKFWKHKSFHELKIVESVGHKGWLATKDRHEKWGLIDIYKQKPVKGFRRYDSFWSFDENGLCMVRLDGTDGYLYGYINEQGKEQIPVEYDYLNSFENRITIAKKDGEYGAIDLNNKTVIPFGLPYEDVRGFRNGRASAKNRNGKWGVIDTNGKEIVPCTNDNIVL